MSLFFFVRHGQTLWNTEKRLQGHQDSPLTDLGRRQALALAQRLKTETFDAVWCSTLGRTRETAALVGYPNPHLSDELKEMNLGAWEGKTKDEVWQTWGERARHFWHTPEHFEPLGGESFATAQARLFRFLTRLDQGLPAGSRVLIISHGMAIQLLLNRMDQLTLAALYHHPVVHQASLTVAESAPDSRWTILTRDDQTHLGALVQTTGQVV